MRPRQRPQQAPAPDWPGRLAALAAQARDPRLARFYRAGAVAAGTPLEQVPLLALDFETTGLDASRHAIVSIGLVPFDLDRIRLPESRHWVVRPQLPLEARSVTLHRITHSVVAAAPDLDEVLGELLGTMAGRVMVVHYAPIERQFLDVALRHRLGEGIEFPVLDTLALEARVARAPEDGWLRRWLRRAPHCKPVSVRLGDARSRYGLPYYQPHNALTDALASAELLQAQVAHHLSRDIPVGELWQ